MTKYVYMVAAAASALLIAAPMVPAEAATAHVLTIGKTGGTAVSKGDVLTSGLAKKTTATFKVGNDDGEMHIGDVHREGHEQPGRLRDGHGDGVGHEVRACEVRCQRREVDQRSGQQSALRCYGQRRQGQSGEGQRDKQVQADQLDGQNRCDIQT